MEITTQISDHLGAYLDISSQELKLTDANMANVDTPNYRTVGIDFAGEMQRPWQQLLLRARRGNLPARQIFRRCTRWMDCWSVPTATMLSMDREGLNMAEAQLRFRTGVELLRREFTRIQSAIQIDGK